MVRLPSKTLRNHGPREMSWERERTRMRSIGIVGGGHAGLQLGIGLRQRGYAVTIVTDRAPDDVRSGRIMSSQGMQHTALQHERGLGLASWPTTRLRGSRIASEEI